MLYQASVTKHLWVEAFSTTNFLIDRLSSPALGMHTILLKKKHLYSILWTFGSRCYPYLRNYATSKFDPRSLSCVFMGYNDKHKGHRCLNQPSGKIYILRHVVFEENNFPCAPCYDSHNDAQVKGELSIFHEWDNPCEEDQSSPHDLPQ